MKRIISIFVIFALSLTMGIPPIDVKHAQGATLEDEVVVYVPGFLGSEIKRRVPIGYNPEGEIETIWPAISSDKRKLELSEDGEPLHRTFVGDILENFMGGSGGHDQTETFFKFLEDNGVSIIKVPFDWRID